ALAGSGPPPVLWPRLPSTGSAAASRLRLSPPRRHPGRPPRIRAVTFPLLPPRVPHCPVGGVGLRRRGPAHPGSAASYAVRVPRCRGLSPASCRLRLATPPLPSTRSYHRLPSRGLSPPSNCPCRAYPLPRLRRQLHRLGGRKSPRPPPPAAPGTPPNPRGRVLPSSQVRHRVEGGVAPPPPTPPDMRVAHPAVRQACRSCQRTPNPCRPS